ncbi:MAG: cell envelope biogenesis protein TolA [Paracoccaceae bacterium]
MYTGQIISGAGHGVLILWLLLGDWLFSPPPPEELSVVSGSLISSADFEAMQAAARANEATAPEPEVVTPPEPEVVEPPPEPAVVEPPPEPEVVEPPPEPEVAELPPEPEVVPEGQTGFAEPSALPPSDTPQPLPNPLADARPRLRPSDLIRQVPVEETPDVQVAETPTPEVSDVPTDQPVVEQPPTEEAAPEAASTELVPEQPEEVIEQVLAPTSSPRPRARPRQVAAAEPEPAAEEPAAVEPAAEEPAPEEPAPEVATDQAAIDAALEAALAGEEPTDGGGTTQSLGEALNASEMNGLANAINRCWDLGAASTAALSASVTLLITLDQNSRPTGVELIDSSGDTPEAIETAERAAKIAVRNCGREGLGLPPEKYETWKQIEVVFDPRGAQLR